MRRKWDYDNLIPIFRASGLKSLAYFKRLIADVEDAYESVETEAGQSRCLKCGDIVPVGEQTKHLVRVHNLVPYKGVMRDSFEVVSGKCKQCKLCTPVGNKGILGWCHKFRWHVSMNLETNCPLYMPKEAILIE